MAEAQYDSLTFNGQNGGAASTDGEGLTVKQIAYADLRRPVPFDRSPEEIGDITPAEPPDIAADPVEATPTSGLTHSYIIDPDDRRRAELRRVLTGRPNMVVRAYGTRESFLAAAETLDSGCVLLFGLDHDPDIGAFVRELRQHDRFACIMLAAGHDLRAAIEAMKAGAVDCLLYPCDAAEVLSSVDDALRLTRRLAHENAATNEARRQIERLTARERDVLQGLLHGKSNKMIAIDLTISPRTVEIYRAHLMEKLGTRSLSETLRIAFAAGMQ
ncbi:MAG TPA: LuxR C-terminal-related transcriptional regulator [Sphingobium sp.]|nr:LuxR C-terminal-related transcriptional regulator [Sphingobium sp.]